MWTNGFLSTAPSYILDPEYKAKRAEWKRQCARQQLLQEAYVAQRDGRHPLAAQRSTASRWHGLAAYRSLASVVVLLTLVIAACGTKSPSHAPMLAGKPTAVATSAGSGAAPASSGLEVVVYQGQPALGGDQVDFTSVLGRGKPVVLNFWGGRCPVCRAEMPDFQAVYNNVQDAVIFVGVDVGPFTGLGSHADAQRLLQELHISYPAGYAVSRELARTYQLQGMPMTVFFSADGRVAATHRGLITNAELRTQVAALLQGPSQ